MTVDTKNNAELNSSAVTANSLVIYENQDSPLLGLITEVKGAKYCVLNERGRPVELPLIRLYPLPGKLAVGDSDRADSDRADSDRAVALAKLHEEAAAFSQSLNLEEIWSFVHEDGCDFAVSDLCRLYYGADHQKEHLALFLALRDDNIFFKRKRFSYSPRPPETVAELQRGEEKRRRKEALQERTIAILAERLHHPDVELPEDIKGQIDLLAEMAAQSRDLDASRLKEAQRLLSLSLEHLPLEIGGTPENQAFVLLRKTGVFSEYSNLALIRHQVARDFSPALLAAATDLTAPTCLADCPDTDQREDHSALTVFTVDDYSTKDMDDGFSVESSGSGYRFGIHISDVALLIAPDSPVDQAARRRGTSFYFPDSNINMLPDNLAEDICSLRAEVARPALSCFIDTDADFTVSTSRLALTLIKSSQRCTYTEVDEWLEQGHPELSLLYGLAGRRETERLGAGAVKSPKKEMHVKLGSDGRLQLVEIDEASPARSLVSELMIFANQLFADFCRQHSLPALFRCQAEGNEKSSTELDDIPEGPARDYAARMGFSRTTVATKAEPHAALGLAAYLQATSPIRRYHDLLNQRQIASFLKTGQPWYNREELERVAQEVDQPLQVAGLLRRESKRFWLLKYLEQRREQNPTIKGTVIRTDMKFPLVELEELLLPVVLKLNRKPAIGETLNLRINRVQAVFDELRLEEVRDG